jgi:hypothetical protein
VVTSINNAHALDTKKVIDVTPVPGGHRVTMSDSAGGAAADNTLQHYLFFDNGRPYHSVLNIKLSSGASETADVTVQGGGTQSVSVPAGTFRATLVTMYIVTKVGSLHSIATLKVWTAPGTGPVKTQQVVKAGGKTQLITTSTLLTFTKQAAGS